MSNNKYIFYIDKNELETLKTKKHTPNSRQKMKVEFCRKVTKILQDNNILRCALVEHNRNNWFSSKKFSKKQIWRERNSCLECKNIFDLKMSESSKSNQYRVKIKWYKEIFHEKNVEYKKKFTRNEKQIIAPLMLSEGNKCAASKDFIGLDCIKF